MRAPVAAAVLALASVPARADDDPGPSPMEGVDDLAAACAALHDGMSADTACTKRGHAALADGALATLLELDIGGVARWAIVVDDHGALSRSPWLELLREDNAAHQFEDRDAKRPRLRVIRGGAAVAIELSTQVTHGHSDPNTSRVTDSESWRTYDLVVCGKNAGGTLACVARHRGARGDSCTGALAADGTFMATCTTTERLGIE